MWILCAIKNMFLCSYVKKNLRSLRAKIFDNSVNFVDSVCNKKYVLMFLCQKYFRVVCVQKYLTIL